MFDVIVVGAGPAGLSAALILGRCRRRVLICDHGRPRNAASRSLHGFLTRDGVAPVDLLRIGREQLRRYETVTIVDGEVIDARPRDQHFAIHLSDGARHGSRMLLLATGVEDQLPEIPGIGSFYGRSAFHCPYCDAWEVRDQPLAAYGRGHEGASLALELTVWSGDVALCTDGPADLSAGDAQRLARHGISLREQRIAGLDGTDGILEGIRFESGQSLPRTALFFSTAFRQQSDLATKLGVDFTQRGAVETGDYQSTAVPGLFVAGDASRQVQLAIVAAAEGAKAAFAINTALWKADMD